MGEVFVYYLIFLLGFVGGTIILAALVCTVCTALMGVASVLANLLETVGSVGRVCRRLWAFIRGARERGYAVN